MHPCSQPPHLHTKELLVPLEESGEVFQGKGEVSAVAIYRSERTGGKWRFHLDRIEDAGESLDSMRARINEQRAIQATKQFYLSPNYSIYSRPPTDEHRQVLVERRHRRAYVDEKIAPLVEALWDRGLETLGSCQERSSGEAYIGFPLARQGALFHKKLVDARIESECKETKLRIRNPDTGEILEINAANVLFSPEDIPRIAAFVRSSSG
jgi:hypothetical protein